MKCFCGKSATCYVTVLEKGENKFLDHPRCDNCKERAMRSYDKVDIKRFRDDTNGDLTPLCRINSVVKKRLT